ncbi:MAG: hypothetical protein ACRC9R_11975, partial [Enterovibrio sp.]
MQPAAPTGPNPNPIAQGQPPAGGPQQQGMNIVGVQNAAGINPAILGPWNMDVPSAAAPGTTITMHLRRRNPALVVTPANQEVINIAAQAFQPDLRPLQEGAEALTADFTVRPPGHPPAESTYRVSGFGQDDRLAMGPLSTADRQRLRHETPIAVSNSVLNAISALTDTDTVLTTTALEQTLEAQYGEKRVKFRRPIGAMPPPEPRLSTPQQETGRLPEGAVGGVDEETLRVLEHNNRQKDKLLGVMRSGQYQFD